ncbi:MAG: hypothetical protein EAZ44_00265 [Cytophagia bacterium]|nr:MAG: hypothetical protein EAZ44_00265 [Cytophagia bacterium]TAG44665.1 MAG: hypothetical protein EAZ31_02030 [Cytophagia bacterium]TAH30675.1 MAG: hypothetical protein EAZ06_02295 [Cytophagales bacterium]
MKSIFFFTFFYIFFVNNLFSSSDNRIIAAQQDTIVLKNGMKIITKIIEITPLSVRYFQQDLQIATSIDMSEIQYIRLGKKENKIIENPENNNIIISNDKRLTPKNTPFKSDNLNMYLRGREDARKFYRDYKAASTATYIISLYPPFGLISALFCSFNPMDKNLGCPYPELLEDRAYSGGYREEAGHIKRKKVWSNFGYGVLTFVGLIILALTLL